MSNPVQSKNTPTKNTSARVKAEKEPRHQQTFATVGADLSGLAPDELLDDAPNGLLAPAASNVLSREPSMLLQQRSSFGGADDTRLASRTAVSRFGSMVQRQAAEQTTQPAGELSGAQWVNQFPTSTSINDLVDPFRANVNRFVNALEAAGATVSINATYRPAERAYLMHYSYWIANENLDPATVPSYPGVNIIWLHRAANGSPDLAASRQAARDMVAGYQIVYAPALQSRHTQRLAIDMNISWSGNLTITNGNNEQITITSTPRTGAGNTNLHAVGATYSVIKKTDDRPHWSNDGH